MRTADEMGQTSKSTPGRQTAKALGDAAEARALQYLQAQGLALVKRNYRTPGRGGGEIDLVMRTRDGTLVFVEVRLRRSGSHGGALASITRAKQQRIIWAARHFIAHLPSIPPCRFDVVVMEQDAPPMWIQAAFDASP
jgi:putative endonuclease